MNKMLLAGAILCCAFAVQAQVKMPQPSPLQTVTQDFGIGKMEISYSRPAVKGRKIFGDLVPFDKMWRTGANAAPSLRITEPVMIMGNRLDTGTYSVYTIPGKKNWEIIINKGTGNWGLDGYKKEEDVFRVTVPSQKSKSFTESFTISFADVKPESCTMLFAWENTEVPVSVTANFRDKLRTQIEEALKKEDKKPYWGAAQFYNEYDKDYSKALENAQKACEANAKA